MAPEARNSTSLGSASDRNSSTLNIPRGCSLVIPLSWSKDLLDDDEEQDHSTSSCPDACLIDMMNGGGNYRDPPVIPLGVNLQEFVSYVRI